MGHGYGLDVVVTYYRRETDWNEEPGDKDWKEGNERTWTGMRNVSWHGRHRWEVVGTQAR